MKSRTPAQVRTWLHNKRKKTLFEETPPKRNRIPAIIYSLFERYIDNSTVPTLEECLSAYHKSPSLKSYSPADLQELVKKAIGLCSKTSTSANLSE